MRILVFGGTRFLGRAIVGAALSRGHELILFHRGLSNPALWPECAHVIGDRNEDLARLSGHSFDAVIDTSAFEVPTLRKSMNAAGEVPYVFVSSISVYSDIARVDEDAPVRSVDDAETAELTLENYGGLKAACETVLREGLGDKALCVRAGKIDGPHDIDARFHYWLMRIARGGEVLAPGDPGAHVQDVDVRDLAEFIVRCVENKVSGVMNATGTPMTMQAMLETIRDVTGSDARFTWVPDEVLEADGVQPYSEMPYWIPARLGPRSVPIDRARSAGLELRPFFDTARDTWHWAKQSWDAEAHVRARRRLIVAAGIDADRERRLLEKSR